MKARDEVATANERHWERMVRERNGFMVLWLDLDPENVRRFAKGGLELVPVPLAAMSPRGILGDVEGKDVLCSARE